MIIHFILPIFMPRKNLYNRTFPSVLPPLPNIILTSSYTSSSFRSVTYAEHDHAFKWIKTRILKTKLLSRMNGDFIFLVYSMRSNGAVEHNFLLDYYIIASESKSFVNALSLSAIFSLNHNPRKKKPLFCHL